MALSFSAVGDPDAAADCFKVVLTLGPTAAVRCADLDLDVVRAARRLFDPVGHYNRPDVFRLSADLRPRPAVTVETAAPEASLG